MDFVGSGGASSSSSISGLSSSSLSTGQGVSFSQGANTLSGLVSSLSSGASGALVTGPSSSTASLNLGGSISSENGPILYDEPNRTAAHDDIRTVVIYFFIAAIFFCFIVILPGIRNEKLPTFFCIGTSLTVLSIIMIALSGTTWHVGQAQSISAAYKAFSRDRIQGDLSVNIGLHSVNISLIAHKYFIHHDHNQHRHLMMTMSMRKPVIEAPASKQAGQPSTKPSSQLSASSSLADELTDGKTNDGLPVDTELEVDEVFAESRLLRGIRSSPTSSNRTSSQLKRRSASSSQNFSQMPASSQKRSIIERHNVDINYNERFYWIEPNQMRQEHHNALERGLPYPILTVVEYLSQDDAGFNWSRQYRAAGYYTYIMLCLALCACFLMFFLHCTAPKYGIYTMQILGGLLLFTNFTYAYLVPKGERKLVIPFEGQSLAFTFGFNFWLVFFGGALSLTVGTIINIFDKLFPNSMHTTILDHNFDLNHKYYKHRPRKELTGSNNKSISNERPVKPPFYENNMASSANVRPLAAAKSISQSNSGHDNANFSDSENIMSERSFKRQRGVEEEEEEDRRSSEIGSNKSARGLEKSDTETRRQLQVDGNLKIMHDQAAKSGLGKRLPDQQQHHQHQLTRTKEQPHNSSHL